jgi:phycoerythrin-associated linker protein
MIEEFLELCSGKWFSQRTHYNLAGQEVNNSKAELHIELLSADDPTVQKICRLNAIRGLKITWDTSVDWGKAKEVGNALLVFSSEGHWFSQGKSLLQGFYTLEEDEMLVLKGEKDNQQIEERLWFPSPNLRLRTTVVKVNQETPQTTFYSEIRKLPTA